MKEKRVEATASKRFTRRDKIEMWMLLDEAVCALRDPQAGKRSPQEESVSETIACIEELQARIKPFLRNQSASVRRPEYGGYCETNGSTKE